MTSYRAIAEALSRWIDRVAETIVEAIGCFRRARVFRLVEEEDGAFTLQAPTESEAAGWPRGPVRMSGEQADAAVRDKLAPILRGAQVEVMLRPKHFLFRLLELPRRAADFLDGIVRAQIDRLTPWSAADAVFGWQPSGESTADQMAVVIAATSRKVITPIIDSISQLGAGVIVLFAAPEHAGPDAQPIRLSEHKAGKAADLRLARRILAGLLASAGAFASLSVAASSVIGGIIEARQEEMTHRIAELRATVQPGREKAGTAFATLEQRKHEAPSSVIVIEALSRILPDDTYLTELRILGDKVQIVGVTHDAPSLIRLIEQIPHFTRATFFAPTTRSKTESGEHFSIEAHIEPVYTSEP
jgi:general secretion pathway protein L